MRKMSQSASVSFQAILPCKIKSGFCCLLLPAGLLELRIHIWVTWGCTSLLLGVGKKTVLNRVHVNNDAGKMWYFT